MTGGSGAGGGGGARDGGGACGRGGARGGRPAGPQRRGVRKAHRGVSTRGLRGPVVGARGGLVPQTRPARRVLSRQAVGATPEEGSAGAREAPRVGGRGEPASRWASEAPVSAPRPAEERRGAEEEAPVPLVQHLVPQEPEQDPRVAAWRRCRTLVCGPGGTHAAPLRGRGASIKKLTRGLGSVSLPALSSWQPRGLSHPPPLPPCGQACGLGRLQPLWPCWLLPGLAAGTG